jgi:predicted metal-dependent hydrolase
MPPEPKEDEISRLRTNAKNVLPERVRYFSTLTGLVPVSIKITSAKTRFGSCSGKNGICFSYLLMRYPPQAVDYVVLHELCHIKHHNHSKNFWSLVEKYMPDYKERKKLLK